MAREDDAVYCLKIDFQPGTPDPARVFRTMSGLIVAFGQLDQALATAAAVDVRATVLLEDIDRGSLRAWLRDALTDLDDADVRDLNWKRILGKFLVRGKYATIEALKETPVIETRQDVLRIQGAIDRVARDVGLTKLPSYAAVPPERLLKAANDVSAAVSNLSDGDSASYVTDAREITIDREFSVSAERVEDLLTREVVTSTSQLILKVKKPDYLGVSMWELRHGWHPIVARIEDMEWLRRFQNRQIDVRPGDSLRAMVRTDIRYGFNNEVVGVHHLITEVIEVIPNEIDPQFLLLPSSEE